MEERATVESLPDEVLLHVFEYLPPFDLFNSARVCHRFNNITVDNHLWHKHLEQRKRLLGSAPKEVRHRKTAKEKPSNLKDFFKKGLEEHVQVHTRKLWEEDVADKVETTKVCGGCLMRIFIGVLITSLLIWLFVHNGEHGTSIEFRKSFNETWGDYCKSENGPPNLNLNGNDWLTLIIFLVIMIIWSPYIIVCYVYPAFYYVLFLLETVLNFLGRITFGWLFGSYFRLEEHKTTSVFLGGNFILVLILGVLAVGVGRALLSYYRKKRDFRRRVLETLKG